MNVYLWLRVASPIAAHGRTHRHTHRSSLCFHIRNAVICWHGAATSLSPCVKTCPVWGYFPEHSWNTTAFESAPSELTARNCCTKPRGGALTMTCGTWMKCKTYYKLSFLVNDMFEYNPEHADSQHSVWKWKAGSEPCWLFMCMHLLRHSMASLVPSACLLWIFIHETVPLQLTVELVMNTVMKPLCPYCVFLPLCVSVCVCLCTVRYSTRHNPATANWVFTYLFHMAEVVVYGSQIRTILHSSRVWRLVSFVSVSKTKKKCKRAWSVN